MVFDKNIIPLGMIIVVLSGLTGFQHYDCSGKILSQDNTAEHVQDEVDLLEYHPFLHEAFCQL